MRVVLLHYLTREGVVLVVRHKPKHELTTTLLRKGLPQSAATAAYSRLQTLRSAAQCRGDGLHNKLVEGFPSAAAQAEEESPRCVAWSPSRPVVLLVCLLLCTGTITPCRNLAAQLIPDKVTVLAVESVPNNKYTLHRLGHFPIILGSSLFGCSFGLVTHCSR